MSDRTLRRLLAAAVFFASLLAYVATMPPTTSFWDSGEFIATSYILGIPHSPGTPLYVLVGRVFSMLPIGMSVAERVNFLSVVFGALGVLLTYLISASALRFMFGRPVDKLTRFIHLAAPAVGAFYLAFSDTYWRDSTEAEVYSLSAFVMGLCTLLALRWLANPSGAVDEERRRALVEEKGEQEAARTVERLNRQGASHARNLVLLIVYLLSMGIGFHLGTILVYGGVFLALLAVREKTFSNFELLVFTFGMAVVVADMTMHKQSNLTVIGLVIFAVLVVWSVMRGGRFALWASLLFALGISVHLFLYIRSGLNPAIDEVDPETWRALYAHLRREQYPPMNILNRKASLFFQLGHFWGYYKQQFRMFNDLFIGPFNLAMAAVMIPTFLGLYGVWEGFRREKKSWIVIFSSLLLNSLGLILFLNFSDHEVRERDYFYGGGFYFFTMFIGIGTGSFLMLLRSQAREAARDAFRSVVPLGAVLLVFSMLPAHAQWHEHDRSDNYIARDYAYNMLAALEPDAIIFTNGDNDTFPLWYIQTVEKFREDVRVANLSLLNTNWYIEQLRDEYPKVPISLSDPEIERLRPIALRSGGVAWKRDLAVQHIIQENNWKQPVYFAVTVPQEVWKPYADYLEMQGMVRRLVPYKKEFNNNYFLMARNFRDIYSFRGVLDGEMKADDSMYKDADTRGMFINFAVAAFQLGQGNYLDGNYEEAVRWTELSLEFSPGFEFSEQYLGLYLMNAGRNEEALAHYEKLVREKPGVGKHWLMLSSVYERTGDMPRALAVLLEGTKAVPNERTLFEYGFRLAAMLGQRDIAVDVVKRWVESHPADKQFADLYRDIDRVLEQEYGFGRAADSIDGGTQ
ncbi:MAG: DUF2723 domain-containing protein [Candidatus Krumholzibacteriota bacterium]|nr:DUF2723 domain-containing protein [Candidatus Krumholzibacteriota bacterium]